MIRLLPALALVALLSACGTAMYVGDYAVSRGAASGAGISDADLEDLRAGRIDRVDARYDGRDPNTLSAQQLGLLCDILLKYRDFARAGACLDLDAARFGRSPALTGKRALVSLALGDARGAARLTESGSDVGSRYVHALAQTRLGQKADAERTAAQLAKQFEPKQVYYAASLYSALGNDAEALRLLEDPQRRLLRDYGVTPNQTAFGAGQQAPFRLDVFDEFKLGPLGNFSYAPAANVYVEYLAAHSLLELGRTDDAIRRLDTLLAYPGLPAYRDVEWLVFYDRGRAARRLGRTGQAQSFWERSVADIEAMRQSVRSDEGRIGFAANSRDVYAALVDLLRENGQADAALSYSERARGRAFVDLLASRNNLNPREISQAETSELLGSLNRAEGQEALASASADPAAALRAATSPDIRRRITSRAPSLAPLVSVSPVGLSDIRATLAPDETAVAYFRAGSGWIAFVLTPRDLRTVALPPLDNAAVLSFLSSVVSSGAAGRGAGYLPGAQALYNALIRPVEPMITGQRLVIVPYGLLHYIPFAALHDGRAHLVERYTIRQVPSLSASVIARDNRAAGSGSLVIGNPARNGDAPSLPAAEQEAAAVARALPASTLLLRSDASLARFRSLAPGKAYLHIASHGQFNSDQPLQSRLLLAPDPGDNGDLTVDGLYGLRLDARLVTLSACETAVSLVSDGDDMVGLVRGFLFAGAQNVVATLWEVSDVTTGELVADFYAGLNETHSVPDALRRAQLRMLGRHPEPFHWAAFTPMSFFPRL